MQIHNAIVRGEQNTECSFIFLRNSRVNKGSAQHSVFTTGIVIVMIFNRKEKTAKKLKSANFYK